MAHPLKLPALGALAVAAAAFGLHLGESAVADINPIHFQGAAVHPRDRGAALPDLPQAPIQSEYALAYGWDQGANARTADCPGCGPAVAPEYASRTQMGYQSDVDVALAPPSPARAVERQEEAQSPFTTEYASVDRYAYYPIEEATADVAAEEEPAYEADEE